MAVAAIAGQMSDKRSSRAVEDYSFCVAHQALVAQRDVSVEIPDALQAAFMRCRSERDTALSLVTASLRKHKTGIIDPATDAETLMRGNDLALNKELSEQIREYRRTGKIPDHASN